MSAPPKSVAANVSLADALQRMARDKISSLLVAPPGSSTKLRANDTAIITERDVLRALAEHGPAALSRPVAQFASKPLIAVPAAAFVYLALARMSRLKLRHLGVEDESGEIIGIVTSRDLLRLRAQEASMLGDALNLAADVPSLAAAWARLPRAAAALIAEGVSGREVAAVISRELGALTAPRRQARGTADEGGRLTAIRHARMHCACSALPVAAKVCSRWIRTMPSCSPTARRTGRRRPVVCAAGRHSRRHPARGRRALLQGRRDGQKSAVARARWRPGARASPTGSRAPIRPTCCRSISSLTWSACMATSPWPTSLWRSAFDAAQGNAPFAKLLAEAAGEVEPGITILGSFRTENGRIDLKRTGLFGIVTSARVLAIRHHLLERSTPARLSAVATLGRGGDADLDALALAHGEFLDLILTQQLADML